MSRQSDIRDNGNDTVPTRTPAKAKSGQIDRRESAARLLNLNRMGADEARQQVLAQSPTEAGGQGSIEAISCAIV
jgi:hypothetical protein